LLVLPLIPYQTDQIFIIQITNISSGINNQRKLIDKDKSL